MFDLPAYYCSANGSQQPPPAKLRALVPPMTLNDLQQQEVEAIPQCGDNNADIPSEFFVDRRVTSFCHIPTAPVPLLPVLCCAVLVKVLCV